MLLYVAIKKERPKTCKFPSFLHPRMHCITQWASLTYSIMKYNDFFKYNSKFQKNIFSCYDQQAAAFQSKYNKNHPKQHIWRHMLYKRTFYFSLNGRHISIEIEIVRFRYVGTNKTFTFYGTLFCAYSNFSAEFIKQAVSSSDELLSPSALTVSVKTLNCWKEWLRNGRILSHQLDKNYKTINQLIGV